MGREFGGVGCLFGLFVGFCLVLLVGGVSVVVGVFCCSVVRMFSQSGAGRVSCASGWKGSAGCSVW